MTINSQPLGRAATSTDLQPSLPLKSSGKKIIINVSLITMAILSFAPQVQSQAVTYTEQQQALAEFGKHVFFDEDMSTPSNAQGCVSCHDPNQGWTFPDSDTNLGPVGSPGAQPDDRGKIKPPTVAYGSFARHFQPCNENNPFGLVEWCGGVFWDGRAEGTGPVGSYPEGDGAVSETVTMESLRLRKIRVGWNSYIDLEQEYAPFLGALADQALNPAQPGIEQNAGERKICMKVKGAHKRLYEKAFGEPVSCSTNPNRLDHKMVFRRVALALSAYQGSPDVNSFSSLRDLALYRELGCKGEVDFASYASTQLCNQLENVKPDQATWGEFPLAFVGTGLKPYEIREINRGHDIFYGIESAPDSLNDGNPGPLRQNASGPIVTGNPQFAGRGIAALCVACHADRPFVDDGTEPRQLYTDQGYHNIGVPFNRDIPNTVKGEIAGLVGHVSHNFYSGTEIHPGEFRSPTLREVAKGEEPNFVKAFAHNGYFKSLEGIIHFYGSRDLKKRCDHVPEGERRPNPIPFGNPFIANYDVIDSPVANATEAEARASDCWPEPEFFNAAPIVVGQFDFYPEEEKALAAYIRALSDTHIAATP
ncbi:MULTISPECIES: cytochrome c peroxidase [Oceanimonas]|uniref:Cytochrome c domain-containing protein n=1 Tax=Oceanimonas doudoroffii TaxID=84158 RepID=A0A233RGL6_9GAMM|nr:MULTISPECIES: cytochrome c peroxidase [Oceanimonas]NHI00858.1 Methylamine utilization protein MauG [Oceanimonas sp. MB9]OXY82536.1 hypothetical protein B6S08_03160 [Oceanimonas doudoroffii]